MSYKEAKYEYEDLDRALEMAIVFEKLFRKDDLYVKHEFVTLPEGRVRLIFTLKYEDSSNMHK